MKENSYTDFMKSSLTNKNKHDFVQQLYIEMLLSELLWKSEKEKLFIEIDLALDEQDKESFMKLSAQYQELCKRYGT